MFDQELSTGNDDKDFRLDVLLVKDAKLGFDGDSINIEMYKNYNESDAFKSHAYVFRLLGYSYDKGEEYKEKKVIQVNFNDGSFKYDKNIGILWYQLKDKNNEYSLEDLKIYDVYLNNYKEICYNEANELDGMLSLLSADSYQDMERIASGNKEALRIMEELKKLAVDEEFWGLYDNEKVQRKLQNTAKKIGYEEGLEYGKAQGIELGKEEIKLEIAKDMLQDINDLEYIAKITKLPLEKIEELAQSL